MGVWRRVEGGSARSPLFGRGMDRSRAAGDARRPLGPPRDSSRGPSSGGPPARPRRSGVSSRSVGPVVPGETSRARRPPLAPWLWENFTRQPRSVTPAGGGAGGGRVRGTPTATRREDGDRGVGPPLAHHPARRLGRGRRGGGGRGRASAGPDDDVPSVRFRRDTGRHSSGSRPRFFLPRTPSSRLGGPDL